MSAVYCDDPKDLASKHIHGNRDDSFNCGKHIVEDLLSSAQHLERHDFKFQCATVIETTRNAIHETLKGKIVLATDPYSWRTNVHLGRKTADFLWDT